jgi:Stress responsive A/B Barrel Domain
MIRHIVLYRQRADLPAAEAEALHAAIRGMKAEIPGIVAVALGPDNSPESLARGYTHGFTVDFADAAGRDAYLPHPDHVKVAQILVAGTEGGGDGILVFDIQV